MAFVILKRFLLVTILIMGTQGRPIPAKGPAIDILDHSITKRSFDWDIVIPHRRILAKVTVAGTFFLGIAICSGAWIFFRIFFKVLNGNLNEKYEHLPGRLSDHNLDIEGMLEHHLSKLGSKAHEHSEEEIEKTRHTIGKQQKQKIPKIGKIAKAQFKKLNIKNIKPNITKMKKIKLKTPKLMKKFRR